MPKIGEVKKGREIGYANKHAKFIWHSCIICNAPRWVILKFNQPIFLKCHKCGIQSRQLSKERRKELSQLFSGCNNPFYGRKHTQTTRLKMSLAPRPSNFGITISQNKAREWANLSPKEKRRRLQNTINRPDVMAKHALRLSLRDCYGDKNSHWLGGISFIPYSPNFNEKTKEQIRISDNHTCQLCNIPQNGNRHDIHHIDYNKNNTSPFNLIELCFPCHNWQKYFTQLQTIRGIPHV